MHIYPKKHICLFLALLFCMSAFSATASSPSQRFSFIPIDYEGEILDALPCSEGLFAAKNESFKSGFIGKDGSMKIDFSYTDALSFENGLAPVTLAGGTYGYISKDNLFEIAPAFDNAGQFHDGLALVEKNTKSFYIDQTGRALAFADKLEHQPVGAYACGVCWSAASDGGYRLLGTDGNFVNDTTYVWVSSFYEDVCWVSTNCGDDFLDFEMQLIDTKGSTLIAQGRYTSAGAFSDGVCWAKRSTDDTLVLIDKSGNELLIAPDTEGVPTPYANGISVGLENGLFTIRNLEGTVIFSSLNYRAVSYGGFSEGCMLVQDMRNGKYYIMQDGNYTASEQTKPTHSFAYATVADENNNSFEIALLIDAPSALVNGQKTYIDKDNFDVKTFTANDRTLVPMRFLSENLPGWSIAWDSLSASAILKSDCLYAAFRENIGDLSYLKFNAETKQYETCAKTLDQPPVLANGRMFLPVRALSEIMDVNVFYDARGLVVFSNTRDTLTEADASLLLKQLY